MGFVVRCNRGGSGKYGEGSMRSWYTERVSERVSTLEQGKGRGLTGGRIGVVWCGASGGKGLGFVGTSEAAARLDCWCSVVLLRGFVAPVVVVVKEGER